MYVMWLGIKVDSKRAKKLISKAKDNIIQIVLPTDLGLEFMGKKITNKDIVAGKLEKAELWQKRKTRRKQI